MSNSKFARHKLTVSGLIGSPTSLPLYFLAPADAYEGLTKEQTGAEKITISGAANSTDETAPITNVESLLKSGFAVRKVIAYTTGSGATRRVRYAKIIVAKDKADTFNPTGSFRGGTIRGVVNPLDAKFS